jgi:hypothetical protein
MPLADLIRIRSASGRVLLPSSEPYPIRFEHISGVPSAGEKSGYSITKLRILDRLLDRLSLLRGEKPKVSTDGLSTSGLERLIEDLKESLHEDVQKASATPFAAVLGAGISENGALVNLLI